MKNLKMFLVVVLVAIVSCAFAWADGEEVKPDQDTMRVNTLIVKDAKIDKAEIKKAEIDLAKIKKALIRKAKINEAEVKHLRAKMAEFEKAHFEYACFKQAEVDLLKVKLAEIETANINTANIKTANIDVANVGRLNNRGTGAKYTGSGNCPSGDCIVGTYLENVPQWNAIDGVIDLIGARDTSKAAGSCASKIWVPGVKVPVGPAGVGRAQVVCYNSDPDRRSFESAVSRAKLLLGHASKYDGPVSERYGKTCEYQLH